MNLKEKIKEKVFKEVGKIKRGEVRSYKEIGEKTGLSPRTVGRILRENPFPIKIPCHRVIRSDGEIGGYFGRNFKKKAELLRGEGVLVVERKGRFYVVEK